MKMVKLFKRVENTLEKEEIARDEQFLLYPQCCQKKCTADMYRPGLVWERLKTENGLLVREKYNETALCLNSVSTTLHDN